TTRRRRQFPSAFARLASRFLSGVSAAVAASFAFPRPRRFGEAVSRPRGRNPQEKKCRTRRFFSICLSHGLVLLALWAARWRSPSPCPAQAPAARARIVAHPPL